VRWRGGDGTGAVDRTFGGHDDHHTPESCGSGPTALRTCLSALTFVDARHGYGISPPERAADLPDEVAVSSDGGST